MGIKKERLENKSFFPRLGRVKIDDLLEGPLAVRSWSCQSLPFKRNISVNPSSYNTIMIKPHKGLAIADLRDLWDYRELLYFLVWRDVKVRYKQTILGTAWAILQPFLTMVVFTLFFGMLAKIPSDGIPYPLFSYTALVPWSFFANGLHQASNSLVGNAQLITKVYFPRLVIPMASVLSGVVDFSVSFFVLFAMMPYYGIFPSIHVLWVFPLFLLAFLTTLGAGTWLSALNVKFRDVRYTVPFLIQLLLFMTPVAYPSSLLAEPWRTLYGLNPMVGVVEGFRWALLGTQTAPGPMIIFSSLAALLLLVSGIFCFRRMERKFADIM